MARKTQMLDEVRQSLAQELAKNQARMDKLPQWARDHIASLEHKLETAVRIHEESLDSATPSQIMAEECDLSGPTFRLRPIQATQIIFTTAPPGSDEQLVRNNAITVQVNNVDGTFTVRALRRLLEVRPKASNTIEIAARDW